MAGRVNLRRHGAYAAVVITGTAVTLILRSLNLPLWGSVVYLLTVAGVLLHAFVTSGPDTRPARTWAESWRPRHLLMIALSLLIGFSAFLVPDAGETAWVLLPVLLACVPLLFTPLGRSPDAGPSRGE